MTPSIRSFFLLLAYFLITPTVHSQDTFSIVAVDAATGEVVSAGASCVDNAANFGGVILISGILPGRGAINGQATVCIPHVNLNLGLNQLSNGASPDEVLDYLFQNDACQFGNENDRQYGVVDFDMDGVARSAAFTGSTTLEYAGHRVGENYAIQGNILLGPEILDSMEARFLNTEGPLAKKLMAAMQGANVPGADSRCLDEGTSSKSAFLRVARPDDEMDNLYLEINIAEEPDGIEPINSLQDAFDNWSDTALVNSTQVIDSENHLRIFPNPADEEFKLEWRRNDGIEPLALFYSNTGQLIHRVPISNGINTIRLERKPNGQLIFVKIIDKTGKVIVTDKIVLAGE